MKQVKSMFEYFKNSKQELQKIEEKLEEIKHFKLLIDFFLKKSLKS